MTVGRSESGYLLTSKGCRRAIVAERVRVQRSAQRRLRGPRIHAITSIPAAGSSRWAASANSSRAWAARRPQTARLAAAVERARDARRGPGGNGSARSSISRAGPSRSARPSRRSLRSGCPAGPRSRSPRAILGAALLRLSRRPVRARLGGYQSDDAALGAYDVNAALADVAFTPSPDWSQTVTIVTRIADAAGTGPAGGIITLSATPLNDAPASGNDTLTLLEDNQYVIKIADFAFADPVDAPAPNAFLSIVINALPGRVRSR